MFADYASEGGRDMLHTVQYNKGQTLSYTEYGLTHGYPVLVQHGTIASIRDGKLFARLIQWGMRVICLARPGYGESSPYLMQNIAEWADIVAVLIDELDLIRFDILGMSSGAPYSYAIGSRFPERARNIYIFSGTPALYDDAILALWPYPVDKHAKLAELQQVAHDVFFPNVSQEDLTRNDIKDSIRNNCFGPALDLKLRCLNWGLTLAEVHAPVFMQHSQQDTAVPVATAVMTAKLLPHCTLELKEQGEHFSIEALDDFIHTAIAGYYNHTIA
jgi:pimeloyl-ACP methyl ester carboxylesterase